MNVCVNCKKEYEGNFCPVCGVKSGPAKKCPTCGAYVSGKYCSECGRMYEAESFVEDSLSDEFFFGEESSDETFPLSAEAKEKIARYCGGIVFKSVSDGCAVSGMDESGGTEIIIPDMYNGVPVTEIGEDAFCGREGLTFVSIPNFIKRIEKNAFRGCTSLEWILIPDSVKSIGPYAFSGCSRLSHVIIPDGVTSIGASAFRNCASFEYVRISFSVTKIGANAFSDCASLAALYYRGTAEEWHKIVGSDSMPSATVYFYSEGKPFQKGNFWHYSNGKVLVWNEEE